MQVADIVRVGYRHAAKGFVLKAASDWGEGPAGQTAVGQGVLVSV
jgi:hypothetical protein